MSNYDKVVKQENPWDVSNIQEFLFYNCPECDIRLKDGEKFVQHALNNHELSKFFLNKPIEEILSPNCEEILNQEREENRKECPLETARDETSSRDVSRNGLNSVVSRNGHFSDILVVSKKSHCIRFD